MISHKQELFFLISIISMKFQSVLEQVLLFADVLVNAISHTEQTLLCWNKLAW